MVSVENLKLDTHVWNSTIRVYDEERNEVKYDFDEIYYDSFGFVKELSISFLTNLTAYQEKKFYIYGSRDKAIVFKNYTLNEWWNSSYEYRKPIVLVEMLGQARNNELTSKHIVFDKNCEHKIINSSLRIVDDNGQSISFFISNATYCAENQLKEADIWFNVTIAANTHTTYWVYFNPLIPIFEDGFESGDYSAWDGTYVAGSGNINITTDRKHNGYYSSKSSYSSGNDLSLIHI